MPVLPTSAEPVVRPRTPTPSPVALFLGSETSNASRAVRTGELVKVMRDVYAPAGAWRELPPWGRYLARTHAVALVRPDAVFVGEAACALHGLPVFGEPPDVHVMLPDPAKSRRRPGIRIHTTQRMPQTERLGGLIVATPAELAVEIAHSRHPAVGLAVAGATLRADPALSTAELSALGATRPSARGVRTARWVFDRATPVAESPLENVSIAVIDWLGFPAPELQHWFRDPSNGSGDRADYWWERWRAAGEADGDIKYSGAFGDARTALQARNARDARLRERGVRATAHWGWRDLTAYAQLRALLLAVGLPLVRPEQTAPLSTLAAALRGVPTRGWETSGR
ncbi:hypothetical protein [Microbacterium sp.]|uniref:hypothetical protein n=1 Tax=Microbacterium sp. TaxID=51671 RepID=UPI0039E4DDD1